MSLTALTSAEISLPTEADGARVSDRIAVLADTVDAVGLTDNHAGQPRMSPLAAVALAREQGVGTIVHVSCRDRNRLALQSQVVGSAALGAEAVLCMQGDPVPGIARVADMTATQLIASALAWSARTRWRSGRPPIPSPRTSTGSCGSCAQDRRWSNIRAVADDLRLRRLEAFPRPPRTSSRACGSTQASHCCAASAWQSAPARYQGSRFLSEPWRRSVAAAAST